ncbi:cytochrome P450 [Astrocystis sublimbata]|nr:cytochrome P450 [Astrocystis sublimbata]
MASAIVIAFAGLVVTYLFLRFLLTFTQDAREPPSIANDVPFMSPLIGMIREKSQFYLRLRDTSKLPIYTLRLPFTRIYIVNSTDLIPSLQKQWRTISFAAIAADAGSVVGMSKAAVKVMHENITSEHGFSVSWPRFIVPAMSPGEDLDAMNRIAITEFAQETEKLRAKETAVIGLNEWSRRVMVTATTEAVWGPQNPYRETEVVEAWETFESNFLTFSMFPFAKFFFPKLYRARERVATAMVDYMRQGGYKTASGLVRKRFEHHHENFGLGIEDIARGELGNTFAVLGNSTPCALWVLFHIFSDGRVLQDICHELMALVQEADGICSIDLASIQTSCPILLSTFQETLRYRAVNPGPRVLIEDVLLDGRILLKKGSMLMIPAPVQHTSVSAWGNDAAKFDHMRFVRKPEPGQNKRINRVAFRAFGGGHILCPGRHFASNEIMALAALMVLQFDVVPVGNGAWAGPTWNNSPAQAGFPVPDEDIMVELRSRMSDKKWHVTYSGSTKALEIVAEDNATKVNSGLYV